MRIRTVIVLPALLCALLLAGCGLIPPQEHSAAFLAMDTVMELTAYGKNSQAAVEDAEIMIHELETLLSVTDQNSEIYRANHGQKVALSEQTAALLTDALSICADTEGALDVTIYPVVRAWGFTTGEYHIPDEDILSLLLENVDYTQVRTEDGVLTLPDGVELDLGAAAKGYAGDRAAELMRNYGVTCGKIVLGGNVQVIGSRPDGTPWRIGIRAPKNEYAVAAAVKVTDKAVVTSGGYERYFEEDGVRYWHILDPSTGYPAHSGLASVTIVSESGLLADCLSTALFVMGPERASEYWRGRDDFEFILIGEDGGVAVSEGLADSFTLHEEWADHELEVVYR